MFHVVFVLLFVLLFLLLGVWWVFVCWLLLFLGGLLFVFLCVCFLPYRPSLWLLRFSDRKWRYTSIHDDEEDIMI